MSNKSKIFGNRAIIALERLGDIFCPAQGDFPSYKQCGCVEHVDKVAAYAPADDLKSLNMLLSILSFMPGFVLRWLIRKMAASHAQNGMLSPTFRMLDFGLKGIIFGTYYSGKVGKNYKGKTPPEVLEFSITRIEN